LKKKGFAIDFQIINFKKGNHRDCLYGMVILKRATTRVAPTKKLFL
jgi:hypothetical protein